MKIPQSAPSIQKPLTPEDQRQSLDPKLKEAANGLEAVFFSEMVKAMRGTVEPSEFSMHNSASDIYQGMLDAEYSETAARTNSLGLSEMIQDYWLRTQGSAQYNRPKGSGQ